MKRRDSVASEGVRRPGVGGIPGPFDMWWDHWCQGPLRSQVPWPGGCSHTFGPLGHQGRLLRPLPTSSREEDEPMPEDSSQWTEGWPCQGIAVPHDFVLESGTFEACLSCSIIIIISAPPYPQGCIVSLQLSSFATLRTGHIHLPPGRHPPPAAAFQVSHLPGPSLQL